MLNTNGIKIARDPAFAPRLATYMPGFEIYLQFDSLRPASLQTLRGEDLTQVRQKALEKLNEHNISTTLVVTLQKGVNDDQTGEIIDFALKQKCVPRNRLPTRPGRSVATPAISSDFSSLPAPSPFSPLPVEDSFSRLISLHADAV